MLRATLWYTEQVGPMAGREIFYNEKCFLSRVEAIAWIAHHERKPGITEARPRLPSLGRNKGELFHRHRRLFHAHGLTSRSGSSPQTRRLAK